MLYVFYYLSSLLTEVTTPTTTIVPEETTATKEGKSMIFLILINGEHNYISIWAVCSGFVVQFNF